MNYEVTYKRKIEKKAKVLPARVKKLFLMLLEDLEEFGPEQPNWQNYSKLSNNKYHCHLSYRYVACWENKKGKIEIEVYYVGSRERAPY